MKVAIVHDWLTGMRGGERCLEVFCELFPQADLHTLIRTPVKLSPVIERMRIRTSFVQRLPLAASKFRMYLPLFPTAIERFDFSAYDLILSISHCVAKGAMPRPGAPHVCYCNTPMRYVWDMRDTYFDPAHMFGGRLSRRAIDVALGYLRRWDARTAGRVTHFVANSHNIAERIRRHYGRDSTVIYPPVDCSRFPAPTGDWRDGRYYLALGALVSYKRMDLVVQAAERLRYPLWVVGGGPEERRLRKLAGSNVIFLGPKNDFETPALYAGCRALLFPGVEDFGIVPLEAMASGRPVAAYAEGGALETVVPLGQTDEPATGVFFREQTPESLLDAVEELESGRFDPTALRQRALLFDRQIFKDKIRSFIRSVAPDAVDDEGGAR